MMNPLKHFARWLRPSKPPRRTAEYAYISENDLPAWLMRRGIIKLWRTAASGERWYRIDAKPADVDDGGHVNVR